MFKKLNFIIILCLLSVSCFAQKQSTFRTIDSLVVNIKQNIPREGTEQFIKPSDTDKKKFSLIVNKILNGNVPNQSEVNEIKYDLTTIRENNNTYLILTEKQSTRKGLGSYIFNLNFSKNIFLEVPHPLFDSNTPEEAVKIFNALDARAIFIAGTHRCSNSQLSLCDGKTEACGSDQPFKVSDAGHFTNNFFQEAHKTILSVDGYVISLHGNNDTDMPDVLVSDGTDGKQDVSWITNRLSIELKKEGLSSRSCNNENIDKLCGTTNVQGRLSNGSTDACEIGKLKGNGSFIHLEQKISVRRNPIKIINALKRIF